MAQIQRLYAIERIASTYTAEQRKTLRQDDAKPILDQLKNWIDSATGVLPQSRLGQAITYAKNQWPQLCAYLEDGEYLIDNNQIENKIRPVAVGRKNYLFAGNHQAAQNAAIIYTMMAACKIHQVNPTAWLSDILDKIDDHPANKIQELLPQNWTQSE